MINQDIVGVMPKGIGGDMKESKDRLVTVKKQCQLGY